MEFPEIGQVVREIETELKQPIPRLIPKFEALADSFASLHEYFLFSDTPSLNSVKDVQQILQEIYHALNGVTKVHETFECDSTKWDLFTESIRNLLNSELSHTINSLRDYKSAIEKRGELPPKTFLQATTHINVLSKQLRPLIECFRLLSERFNTLLDQIT